MSVSSINYSASVLGQSVQNLNNQLTTLSTQLSSGVKSTNYAGMGVNEGFAIAARAQLANITAFGTTMTNVNTIISAANTALDSVEHWFAGAERCLLRVAGSGQYWTDHRAGDCGKRTFRCRRCAEHPGRRSLHFLGQRDQHPRGRFR